MNETRSSILGNDGECKRGGKGKNSYTGVMLLAPFGDCVSTSSSTTASEQHSTAYTAQSRIKQKRTEQLK